MRGLYAVALRPASSTRPSMPHILTSPDSPLWLWIDRTGILLGYVVIGTLAVAGTRWWRGVRRRERHIRQARQLARGDGVRRVALCITTPKGGIDADVRRYLAERSPGWSFPDLPAGADDPGGQDRCPVVTFEHEEETVSASGADADLERLRHVAAWLKEEGFGEVHLFMRGPVAFGAAVGCLFANWGEVHVHHFDRGRYEYWFSLAEVKRIAGPVSVVDDVSAALARRLAERPAAPPSHA
jgi:hypothetical protein